MASRQGLTEREDEEFRELFPYLQDGIPQNTLEMVIRFQSVLESDAQHQVPSDVKNDVTEESESFNNVFNTDEFDAYTNLEIYNDLKELGDNPLPVSDDNRQQYIRRLAKIKYAHITLEELKRENEDGKKYFQEIYMFLKNDVYMREAYDLENKLADHFKSSKDRRCYFNYLLLDPTITNNLPRRKNLTEEQSFLTYLRAIFYIGKGSNWRPHDHLSEAKRDLTKGAKQGLSETSSKNRKIDRIWKIWDAGRGVISLHCFQNSTEHEAFTREACMIEAMGRRDSFTNISSGTCRGPYEKLEPRSRKLIGISLLNKAFKIFLNEGEREITVRQTTE